MTNHRPLLRFILLGFTAFACQEPENSAPKDEISSVIDDAYVMGQAYRSDLKSVLSDRCVTTTAQQLGNQSSSLKIEKGLQFDQVLDQLDINNTVAAKIKFVDVKATLNIAKSHSATDLEQSFTLLWKGNYQDDVAETVAWSELGQQLLAENNPETFKRFCGQEFIYRVNHKAWLIATLKLQFQSREDKDQVTSALEVSIENVVSKAASAASTDGEDGGKPLAQIKNEVSKLNETLSKRVKVLIEIHQLGGAPEASLGAVKSLQCNLSSIEECLNELVQFPEYLEIYKSSLAEAETLPVHSFETKAYTDYYALRDAPVSNIQENLPLNRAIEDVWVQVKRNFQVKELAESLRNQALASHANRNIEQLLSIKEDLVQCLRDNCNYDQSLKERTESILESTKPAEIDADGVSKSCIQLPARVTIKSLANDNYIAYNERYESYTAEGRSPAVFTVNGNETTLTNNRQVTFYETVNRGLSRYGRARGAYSWGLTYYPKAEPVLVLDADSQSDETCIKNGSKVFLKMSGYYIRTWMEGSWKGYLFSWDSHPEKPSFTSHLFEIREAE
ncbi:hypothetical protein [Pseudobacteriovorax antillogorgiicola]|uniref:Uncharacterized protein n=1 Tax=Pseudobacteriovorax antillogorgiicola TaxID=1513793 RepID=A0A1Y6BG47_9BACT|nr:hypothetical protein [Pseudobacteriovorax antillogorgiicola]TCS56291.1 hypothetical protein EDD56_104113 [Pseudobacteriovorax antillogorgiicola]SMF07505.1 hypothetical protein SAMN06296036_104220 [Pseudobacteriovorax antillogorgiicola]